MQWWYFSCESVVCNRASNGWTHCYSFTWLNTNSAWLMSDAQHWPLVKTAFIMYTKGGADDFWGVLKFFEEKRGDGENFWRQESWMPIYLDAIERLSIYNIVGKTSLVQWKMFLLSFTFCNNQLYPHYHYHLYFYPAFINNVTDCFHSHCHHLRHHDHYHHHHHYCDQN